MKQFQRQCSIIVLLMGWWVVTQPAAGQYTTDYQTNTISGVVSNWPGDYVVGSNTFADALVIRSGGALTNADGYSGYLAASSSNYVMVTGAGSTWSNANLYFGYSGSGNRLVITNAGRVADGLGTYVGYDATGGSNRVLVTRTNSVWDCANNLTLGYSGSGNSLVVSNGGRVNDSFSEVGREWNSSGNSVLITGGGSVWSNSASCTIGRSGSNNRMTINNGGRLNSVYASVGMMGSASNNAVVVAGSDSLWHDSGEPSDINIGGNGPGNSLLVTNGGQVLGYYAYLGRMSSSDNNSILVTGPGSSFSVNCYIYTGYQGHDNTFTAANGAAIADKFCYISHVTGSSNNAVLLTGPNTFWTNSWGAYVGYDGAAGSLTIGNGATMGVGGAWTPSHDGVVGYGASSSNNWALITGSNSVWSCAERVFVGFNGPANTLVISNGGRVIDANGYLGGNPGSDGNNALVVSTNSVWTNSADLYVGDFGVGNSLVISNAGRVFSSNGFLGRNPGSDNNRALVAGAGSVWTNSTDVYVGCYGAGNSLVITNGGRVSDNWGVIGYDFDSFNNQALVTGTGSLWTSSGDVYIGEFGSANSLVITNGGRVSDDWGVVGYDTNSLYSQALVTGAGSVWSNATVTFVGYSGSSNSLVISDGGLVTDYYGILGQDYSSWDNYAYVEPGGVWRNVEFYVGDGGSHNALYVEGGSVFVSTYMAVGYSGLYVNNLVEMTDGQIIVTNQTHDAVLEVYGGGLLLAGGTLLADTIIVTNEGAQFMYIGGTLGYRNLVLTPEFDADSDGIPNGWEQAHGLDPLNPDDAAADNDGDGMSNLQEYLAGTDLNDAASRFAITSWGLTNGHVRLWWSAVGGKSYVVQTNSVLGGSFADASPVITVPGTSEMVTNYLDPGSVTSGQTRLYRVRLGP